MRAILIGASIVLILPAQPGRAQHPDAALSRMVDAISVHAFCRTVTTCAANPAIAPVESFVRALDLATLPNAPPVPPTRVQLDAALAAVAAALPDANARLSAFSAVAPDLVRLLGLEGGSLASGGAGLLSFPAIALSVTDFLIDRAKAELTQSTFRDIEMALGSGDLSLLLPTTRSILRGVDTIGYRTLLPAFRSALRTDLRAFPGAITNPALSIYRGEVVPPGILLVGALSNTVVRLNGGEDVLAAVGRLRETSVEWAASTPKDIAQLAGAIALETRTAQARAGNTAGSASLVPVLRNRLAARVFAAFLLADTELRPRLADLIWTDITQLSDIVSAVDALRNAIAGAQPLFGGTPIDPGDAAARIVSSIGTVVIAASSVVVPASGDSDAIPVAERIRRDVHRVVDVWNAVQEDDYPTVVALVVSRLSTEGLDPKLMRYITFAASVASVQDSEELTAVIEAFVDPVGSFRSRRLARSWKVSVVSYLGGSTGFESVEAGDADDSGYGGAFAPVGLEFSFGTGSQFPSSIGLYASFVDVGTLVSYRFNGSATVDTAGTDTIATTPDISFEHIFSPAVHLVLGLTRNHPISLGVGYQRAPALRALGSGETVSVNRFSVFFGVDLTLLRF